MMWNSCFPKRMTSHSYLHSEVFQNTTVLNAILVHLYFIFQLGRVKLISRR